jgi:hypothetical protein
MLAVALTADSTRTIQGISDELAASKMRSFRSYLSCCAYSGLLAARQARGESIGRAPMSIH